MRNHNTTIKDALYNCVDGATQGGSHTPYAKGLLVGLMTGLLDRGMTFESGIALMYKCTAETLSDLRPHHVAACLPESWVPDWNDAAKEYEK